MAQQTLDQLPQLLILGLQFRHDLLQHSLEDSRFVGECREWRRHLLEGTLVRLKEAIPPSRPGSKVGAGRRCGPWCTPGLSFLPGKKNLPVRRTLAPCTVPTGRGLTITWMVAAGGFEPPTRDYDPNFPRCILWRWEMVSGFP
jgi:hypothetical protein